MLYAEERSRSLPVISRVPAETKNYQGSNMSGSESLHMSPEAFRKWGREVIDWIADYYEQIENYPVLSQVQPGEIRSQLPPAPPAAGEDFKTILADMDSLMPGITHWQSPNFFAFFPANTSFPSMLGELITSGLGVQGMLWATSPACTELETHVLDWLADMLQLPGNFKSSGSGGGVIQDTASSATLCALLAARERNTGYRSNETGCDGSVVAYASTQTHSSLDKAVRIAGIGSGQLRKIDVNAGYAMIPDLLKAAILKDKEAGLKPAFVCATVGTTSSNAMDPIQEIGKICQDEGLWLHVDAAMSGTAAICPEFRSLLNGIELADSFCFNPHKWMFTNFDCDCFFVKDRASLINTLSVLPEYLKNKATESGAVFDYRDWHIPLGRRFRALKLWFVIRFYGVEGLQTLIRNHVKLAQAFAGDIEASPDFELAAPVPLNLVCFRHKGGDAVNKILLDRLNQSGRLYLTHTKLDDRITLRFCVGQTHTEQIHVQNAWKLIQETAHSIRECDLKAALKLEETLTFKSNKDGNRWFPQ